LERTLLFNHLPHLAEIFRACLYPPREKNYTFSKNKKDTAFSVFRPFKYFKYFGSSVFLVQNIKFQYWAEQFGKPARAINSIFRGQCLQGVASFDGMLLNNSAFT